MTQYESVQATLANHGMLPAEDGLARLTNRSDADLWQFIDAYRTLYRSEKGVLIGDVQPPDGGVAIWPDHTTTVAWDVKLRGWSLWADRVFVSDPMLSIGGSEHLGRLAFPFSSEEEPVAERLGPILQELFEMLPFVEQGLVTLTGLELLREPAPKVPVVMPPTPWAGLEPAFETGLSFLRVAAMERRGGHLLVPDHDAFVPVGGELAPLDALAFEFADDGDGEDRFGIQMYAPIVAIDPDDSKRMTWSAIPADNATLDIPVFQAWATQQSQAYVVRRLEDLLWELSCAATLNARFFTTSAANRAMATSQGHATGGTVARRVLDLDLPFLQNVALSDLAEFRRDSQAVQNFRTVLLDVVNLIQAAPGSANYELDVKDARHHLLNDVLPAMRREVSRTKWQGMANVAVATALTGLAGVAVDMKGAVLSAITGGAVAGSVALGAWHDKQTSPAMFQARLERRADQESP